jgi:hypothetical protein
MRKSWLLCVLLSTIAWGQAPPGAAAPTPMAPNAAPQAAPAPAPEVPEDAVVMTITGVCPATSMAAAHKTAAAEDAKAAPVKTAAPKKPADCKTVLTRRDFEKIASGLSPNITPQLKRQLGQKLPQFMAMSEAAKKKGLDKTEAYKQTLKVAQMQILTQQLQKSVQEEADKVTPGEEKAYYEKNKEAYDQFSVDRLFVPRNKQEAPDKADDDAKLTDEQQKAKEAADKAKQDEGEQELTKLADTLRERASKGDDITTLQKEAFTAAGMKMDSPTVNLPKVRRTGLPPAHAEVFDLKVGEVSKVITDNGGHYIYKVVSRETLPFDQVTQEIHNTLKNQRVKDMMEKYTNSYHVDENEAYFGPPGPPSPMGRPGARPMPMPGQGRPNGAAPGQAGPAPQAPPAKPN